MSTERQNEIIELLENTITAERKKSSGDDSELIKQLSERLEKVRTWEKVVTL